MEKFIKIYGACEHNLKNVDVTLPRNQLIVFTGISGSGKSSLAFDTIYAEGQRRYLESFSAYARQFIGDMKRPDVEKIDGLSPVIAIEQKTVSKNPRSTVGTVTEIYDFLRLLFARAADAYSHKSGNKMKRYTEDEITDLVVKEFKGQKIAILAPLIKRRKGHYRELFDQLRKKGYQKVRCDGEIINLEKDLMLNRYTIHDIELVVDRLEPEENQQIRLSNSVQTALKMGNGSLITLNFDTGEEHFFSKFFVDPETGLSYDEAQPNTFSFNSPYGCCPKCQGLGEIYDINEDLLFPNSKLSIAKGGLAPLGTQKKNFTWKRINGLANRFNFKLNTPVGKLPNEIIDILINGSEERFEVSEEYGGGGVFTYKTNFSGVANLLKDAYQDKSNEKTYRWAQEYMTAKPCDECFGYRLNKEALSYKIDNHHIGELVFYSIGDFYEWFNQLPQKMNERQLKIASEIIKEIKERTGFLIDVGLDYLTLNAPSKTLSGGEAQRIRLATQIGSKLEEVLYILDEPSIGLHQRDNHRLIQSLKNLRDVGNSIIVVEHDKDIMLESDFLVDIGPGAGVHGGQIVAAGPVKELIKLQSETAEYLKGNKKIEVYFNSDKTRRKGNGKSLKLINCSGNNLKNISVNFPLGKFIAVSGVSGSGKSTLINETLEPALSKYIYNSVKIPLRYEKITGLKNIDKVISIDQSPIGRTPRSVPATYVGFFNDIRQLFVQIPEAAIRGFKPGRFSFNVKGGRCESCKGSGIKTIEMNFLPDVELECTDCYGKRYNRETLAVRYKGKSIADVLEMTVETALDFFENVPYIHRKVKALNDVGLGYIQLGQSSTTLSGGEAQRVKLASELCKIGTGKTFYILDEPTTGLHFQDINKLLDILHSLVDKGNTVLVIEHNLDVIKTADWVIDLGPNGGAGGGEIVAEGTPEQITQQANSHTGIFLKNELR